ncbi:MAG: hypothetical protein OXG05_09850 [Gammaproteobacteria bacterium]|nr:hypothetical protein [Gammaproteobacteria bacterium]
MTDAAAQLLDDQGMQGFIREGFVILSSALSSDYHQRMQVTLDDLEEGCPRDHNNLLPCIPELSQMLEEPVVHGWSIEALQRLTSPEATKVALQYLVTTRWDHTPKFGDTSPDARAPKHVVTAAAR